MPIPVTCPKCHTRFKVSEKFAGQKGPCPKCKEVILVPKLEDEVVISAPVAGPKDGKGRQILKPIKRKEFYVEDKMQMPMWMMVIPMAIVAPLVAYGAYNILKDQEIESFVGQELWLRVLICGAIYALLWAGMPLAKYAFGDRYDTGSWILASLRTVLGPVPAGARVGRHRCFSRHARTNRAPNRCSDGPAGSRVHAIVDGHAGRRLADQLAMRSESTLGTALTRLVEEASSLSSDCKRAFELRWRRAVILS